MQFEELWDEIGKQNQLPQAAIDTVPSMLSEATKIMLQTMNPHDVCVIIKDSINEVDEGSVMPLNSIVLKKINDLTQNNVK